MQNVGGTVRPATFQEAKGHGIFRWDGSDLGDGVVYFPGSGAGEVPSSGNDRSVAYRLVNVFAGGGLWANRSNALTFASWGTLRGDNGQDNDGTDGSDFQRGLLATDPAKLVSAYFNNEGNFALAYTRNGYQ